YLYTFFPEHSCGPITTLQRPGTGSRPAPLLQILRVAGAQEELFTLKEVMHYLGQYIMMKQLYDKQRQHIVHCQDDPLGELLEVGSFSVKNPRKIWLADDQYKLHVISHTHKCTQIWLKMYIIN
uniref:DM2 domain-containing protein n=1 Tax=Cyprinus carpio TaxID=7962 RepID=A0A8C1LM54_CYPCA